MLMDCSYHKKKHDDYEWRSWGRDGETVTICRDGLNSLEQVVVEKDFVIGGSKDDQRSKHWTDIKSRVTTHEGQFLTGKAGREYQKKYSRQYLGRDLSAPTNFNAPDYQKELNKKR